MKYLFKKLILFTISFGLVLVVSSCDEDEEVAETPSLTVTTTPADDNNTITASIGEEVTFDVSVTAEAGFSTLDIIPYVDEIPGDVDEFQATSADQTSFQTFYTFPVTVDMLDSEVAIVMEATDNNGRTTSETFTIVVDATVDQFTAVLLEAPLGDESSETFFSSNTGEVYSKNQIENEGLSEIIDFVIENKGNKKK